MYQQKKENVLESNADTLILKEPVVHYRPVSNSDGPITACYRFIASWVGDERSFKRHIPVHEKNQRNRVCYFYFL